MHSSITALSLIQQLIANNVYAKINTIDPITKPTIHFFITVSSTAIAWLLTGPDLIVEDEKVAVTVTYVTVARELDARVEVTAVVVVDDLDNVGDTVVVEEGHRVKVVVTSDPPLVFGFICLTTTVIVVAGLEHGSTTVTVLSSQHDLRVVVFGAGGHGTGSGGSGLGHAGLRSGKGRIGPNGFLESLRLFELDLRRGRIR